MVLCNKIQRPIRYQDFGIVEDAVNWANGMCNLYKPLRNRGNWKDYLSKYNTGT